ncbi:hypothetical protein PVMG_02463 [Plasmodium vivax Mauritania I]|uniref:Vacuolar protein sorting-associated protein 13 DH-like domain-containing protein n=1 Tax=Plasmodium vivax Mauritania I TaxID=1035515 RepID=A0A0J9THH7_PLAVI|nr:hypothetical protein PVMG_02463 [Plasmodium vivax Mauritania I]
MAPPLQIPLLYLFQKASLKISDVVIVVKEKNFNDFNIDEEINGIKEAKKNNLKIEDINNNEDDLNHKINKGINYLLYELYNNMSIDIENLEIILESAEKKKNIVGLSVKNVSSVKSQNSSNKISKNFSFSDVLFYMEDEKAKYLLKKVIKKEEKKKKNKRNINEVEMYNKIKDICNDLHTKKYIISEIPLLVLSTNFYIGNCTEYSYRNAKFIFKKKNFFDITCPHCDRYLYQCKEVKKERSLFRHIFPEREELAARNKKLYAEFNAELNAEVCGSSGETPFGGLRPVARGGKRRRRGEEVGEGEEAEEANEANAADEANLMDEADDADEAEAPPPSSEANAPAGEAQQPPSEDPPHGKKKPKRRSKYSHKSLYYRIKDGGKCTHVEQVDILEENLNVKENEYMTFEIHVDRLNVRLSFKQLSYLSDLVTYYSIYGCFVNGLYLEEWLNIPDVKDILIYKRELMKKKKKEKHDKDFIEKFEYTHSFQVISSLRKHVGGASVGGASVEEASAEEASVETYVGGAHSVESSSSSGGARQEGTGSISCGSSGSSGSNGRSARGNGNGNGRSARRGRGSGNLSVSCSFRVSIGKVNLTLFSHEKTTKSLQLTVDTFEYHVKNYINNDFAYHIRFSDAGVNFVYKGRKYPLLELFPQQGRAQQPRHHQPRQHQGRHLLGEGAGYKRDVFRRGKRKSKAYLFNGHLGSGSAAVKGEAAKGDAKDTAKDAAKNGAKNAPTGETPKQSDAQKAGPPNGRLAKQDEANRADKAEQEHLREFIREPALTLFVYKKFDTSQSKMYIRCNQNVLITLSIREIHKIMNMNYHYNTVNLEKKIKTYKSLYYYYLLGKKYCKELYVASEKDFVDMNLQLLNNVYVNLVLNKKYSLLVRLRKIRWNSFFFTKTHLRSHVDRLTMLSEQSELHHRGNIPREGGEEPRQRQQPPRRRLEGGSESGASASAELSRKAANKADNGASNNANHANRANGGAPQGSARPDEAATEGGANVSSGQAAKGAAPSGTTPPPPHQQTSEQQEGPNKRTAHEDTSMCENSKMTMKYRKHYRAFLRSNNLADVETARRMRSSNNSCSFSREWNANGRPVDEGLIDQRVKGEPASSEGGSDRPTVARERYIFGSQRKNVGSEQIDSSVDVNVERQLSGESSSMRDVVVDPADDPHAETEESAITTIEQARVSFYSSIFIIKNRSDDDMENCLTDSNEANRRYLLKPQKIYLDQIIYNSNDNREKKITFVHSKDKHHLSVNLDDKTLFKFVFFYFHYASYIDYISHCFRSNKDCSYLNLNTIDIRSYKTLQILLDNAVAEREGERGAAVQDAAVNEAVVREAAVNRAAVQDAALEEGTTADGVATKEVRRPPGDLLEEGRCGAAAPEGNSHTRSMQGVSEEREPLKGETQGEPPKGETQGEPPKGETQEEPLKGETHEEPLKVVAQTEPHQRAPPQRDDSEEDARRRERKDSLTTSRRNRYGSHKNRHGSHKNRHGSYKNRHGSHLHRCGNNEEHTGRECSPNVPPHGEEPTGGNKQEVIVFVQKAKFHFNNYKRSKRMVSVHLSDVLLYTFSDACVSTMALNMKKINLLNCLLSEAYKNNFISHLERRSVSSKVSRKNSKLSEMKRTNSSGGIYFYSSLLKLVNNGNFMFAYSCRNRVAAGGPPEVLQNGSYLKDKRNGLLYGKVTAGGLGGSALGASTIGGGRGTDGRLRVPAEGEESDAVRYFKTDNYRQLYDLYSDRGARNPNQAHQNKLKKKHSTSVDFVHTSYYNNLNTNYFTFTVENSPGGEETKVVGSGELAVEEGGEQASGRENVRYRSCLEVVDGEASVSALCASETNQGNHPAEDALNERDGPKGDSGTNPPPSESAPERPQPKGDSHNGGGSRGEDSTEGKSSSKNKRRSEYELYKAREVKRARRVDSQNVSVADGAHCQMEGAHQRQDEQEGEREQEEDEAENDEEEEEEEEDGYPEEGYPEEEEEAYAEEYQIGKSKENENIKNLQLHLVNAELIVDYLYMLNLYRWISKLGKKFERIRKISSYAFSDGNNSVEESASVDVHPVKYSYSAFLQNNRICVPIYQFTITQYTFHESVRCNSYVSLLPVLEVHFSASCKSANGEGAMRAKVRRPAVGT